MKVFIAATSLASNYGGPAVSVSQLARALGRMGVEVGLWAADGSAAASAGAECQRLSGSAGEAMTSFGRPDVLHDNGIWLPHNHKLAVLAERQQLPRLVSTRGMLEPWARRHKSVKKALAWLAYQARDLRGAQLLHATSDAEAETLRELPQGPEVEVIPNGVETPQILPVVAQVPGAPRIALFIGRIYPVKGLPMLIEAWGKVRPPGWSLHIVGPDEAGHQGELERLVITRHLSDVVCIGGPVTGTAKSQILAAADLLVLPSHTESFGIVVAEALAHATPVLATTAVPWPQLEMTGCGWRVPPTIAGLADGLRCATMCSPDVLRRMGSRGRELVSSDYGWPAVASQFLAVYERLACAPNHHRGGSFTPRIPRL